MMNTLLSAADLCKRWNISKSYICRLAQEHKIPARLLSSGWIFDLEDVKEFEKIQQLRVVKRYGIAEIARQHAVAS